MPKKTASSILSERQLRRRFEDEFAKMAMIDTDRLGRGGRPSGPYFRYLEDIVRTWYPELMAMMKRERDRTVAQHDMRRQQKTIFDTEKQQS